MTRLLAILVLLAGVQAAAAAPGRPTYALAQPAGVVALRDGSLLLAERGSADRILRVDMRTGAFTVFARGVPDPFGIARAGDGSFFVSSDAGLYRVPRTGGTARLVAPVPSSPLAAASNGDLYYAHRFDVGLLQLGARKPVLLGVAVDYPHGIALDGLGGLVVSDTGRGRIVRIDLRTRRLTILAARLRNPMGLVLEPNGDVVAIEYGTNRLLRLHANRPPETVARGLRTPYAIASARGGAFYVVETGDVVRPTGGLVRVESDGMLERLRLHPA